jgi:hypothetical protein
MARTPALVAALVAALACTLVRAGAQQLVRLHVRSMTLTAVPSHVRLGDVIRLSMRLQLAEPIGRLDNVTLPDLTGFDVLGDERRCAAERGGTVCTETLSLAPSAVGTRTIAPITLDAIDARTGRPTRFGTNPVTVVVEPASPLSATNSAARALADVLGFFGVVAIAAAVALAILIGVRTKRRSAAPARVAPVAETPRPSALDDDARWRTLVGNLQARPTRARVDAVRAALRGRVGARDDETFGDLVARGALLSTPSAMEALRLIERAAFVDDDRLEDAVADALPALHSVAGLRRASPAHG